MLVNSLIPGATVSWLAHRLRLAETAPPAPPASVELVSLREYPGDFVWYYVARVSAVSGALISELPLPDGCVITLLLRGHEVLAPRGDTRLLPGDHVCVFVTREQRSLLELLFGREESEPA